MPERKQKQKQKKKQKGNAKPFRYGAKIKRAPDPYYAMLNNIQQQAHMAQVNSLVGELRQAHDFARRARQEAIDDIYRPVTPMEIDEHAPPTRADVGGRSMRQERPTPMEGITTDHTIPVRSSRPTRMEGITRDRPRARSDSPARVERERKGKAPMTKEQLEKEAREKGTRNRLKKVRAAAPHSMSQPPPATSQPTNLTPPGVEPSVLNTHPVYRPVLGGVYPPQPTAAERGALIKLMANAQEQRRDARIMDLSNIGLHIETRDPRPPSLVPARRARSNDQPVSRPPRQRAHATETYNDSIASGFERGSRNDTEYREYRPITRDNQSRRVVGGTTASSPRGRESRFANLPQ